jgi:hypothetical protein
MAASSAPAGGGTGAPLVSTAVMHDFNGDGHPDLLGLTSSGNLYLNIGTDTGFTGSPALVGTGWQNMKEIVAAGDFNGDGHADLIAKTPTGDLRLYYGTGVTSPCFTTGPKIGTGFTGWTIVAPGDWTGDTHPDLIARSPTGVLRLFTGNTAGTGFSGVSTIGTGWQTLKIVAPGDWNGDGHPDLIAKFTNGILKLYEGNGLGVSAISTIGSGWQSIKIAAPGDWNTDGNPDIVGRFSNGLLKLYEGNGTGFSGTILTLGSGWQVYTAMI